MPVFSKGDKNILFLHIPKSAGSTIEKMGAELGWSESFSIRGKALREIRYCKASLQHLHAEPLELLLNMDEFDSIFTVVRNPFSRLKSEYYWQRAQRITDLGVDEWIADTFEKYSSNSYVYDNHIRPQVEFLPTAGNLQVFKLEEDGVAKAKEVFLSLSPEKSRSWAQKFTSLFAKKPQEKRSQKDPAIETIFSQHYEKIVKFYQDDYSVFSYKE